MSKYRYRLHGALAVLALLASLPISAAAIKEIKDASAEARQALAGSAEHAQPEGAVSTARLEAALKRGEEINASLQSEVETPQDGARSVGSSPDGVNQWAHWSDRHRTSRN
jgi:hypothetical protein